MDVIDRAWRRTAKVLFGQSSYKEQLVQDGQREQDSADRQEDRFGSKGLFRRCLEIDLKVRTTAATRASVR